MWKEIEELKNHPDLCPDFIDLFAGLGDFFPIDPNLTTGWFFQVIDTAQQGRFP
jgi:hypothetical protein